MKRALLVCALLAALPLRAQILFESFYRIEKNGRHIGYAVQRLSHKNNQRTLNTYSRTKADGRDIFVTSQSIVAWPSGKAIEATYVNNAPGHPSVTQAKFKNGVGTVRQMSQSKTIPRATFPGAFLYVLADLEKLRPGQAYRYNAYLEDFGQMQIGHVELLGTRGTGGNKVLHVLNDDSGQPVESFLSPNGDPLGSRSVATGVTVYWVPTKAEAVGDMMFPTGEMTKLFGDLPRGDKHPWKANVNARQVIAGFPLWTGDRAVSAQQKAVNLPLKKVAR